jgi:carboxylesterase type B
MWGPDFPTCKDRVCHAADLPATFNSVDWLYKLDPAEKELADSMNSYWTNFATTGNPNYGPSKVAVTWDEYKNKAGTMRLAKGGNSMITDYMKDDCDFWDSIGYFL